MENIAPEAHPLEPFLPANAKLLMLGSFPPQRKRWSMDFYYPNFQNDMWRIFGNIFFGDRGYFISPGGKAFDRERIVGFLTQKGIALYDTASVVRRLKENASDRFLEIVEPTDIGALLRRLPECRNVAATGGKAAETLCRITGCARPAVGAWSPAFYADRELRIWRMPSTSRAYPRPVEWKAAFYRKVFEACGIL